MEQRDDGSSQDIDKRYTRGIILILANAFCVVCKCVSSSLSNFFSVESRSLLVAASWLASPNLKS